MLRCKYIPLAKRLALQLSLHPSPRSFFLNLIHKDGDRYRFYQNGIDLVSTPISSGNPKRVAEGFALVIGEMYAWPLLYWREVRPTIGQTVLDLGANVGTASFVLSRTVGPDGRVYAFEPIIYETLALNVAANNLNNVKIIPVAVGAHCGKVEMIVNAFAADNRIAYGLVGEELCPEKQVVAITTIDDWCRSQILEHVDFIKMDVEGAEEDVLLGAKYLIQSCHPMWSIATEHLGPDSKHTHRRIVSLLRSFGYFTKEIGNDYVYAWYRA